MGLIDVLSKLFFPIQFIAAVASIYFWKNYRKTSLWIFMPYLIYTFLNEITVYLMAYQFKISPRFLYNIYILVTFGVLMYWFDKLLNLKKLKFIPILIFVLAVSLDFYKYGLGGQFFKLGLVVQAITVLVLSFIYFSRLLKMDKVINYQKIPEFWIILGNFVFYIAFVPLSLVTGIGLEIITAYYIAINVLNYILYGCYIIGFYVTSK